MLTCLAAVLHITNVTFHAEGNADSAAVSDLDQLSIVADLLQVSTDELRLSLMQEANVMRGKCYYYIGIPCVYQIVWVLQLTVSVIRPNAAAWHKTNENTLGFKVHARLFLLTWKIRTLLAGPKVSIPGICFGNDLTNPVRQSGWTYLVQKNNMFRH